MGASSPCRSLPSTSVVFRLHSVFVGRTKPRVDCGLGAACFPDHDGGVRVLLLHGGIAAREEVPVSLSVHNSGLRAVPNALPRRHPLYEERNCHCRIPHWSAMLARLAEQKP